MIEEECREICPVMEDYAIAWTGYVWRILERVTDDGKFITWPQAFERHENAVRWLAQELERQARRCRERA